jgi:DNA-binding MarR family transcriptional regulator
MFGTTMPVMKDDRADRTAARRDGRPLADGDIRARVQQLHIRQQRFERHLARLLQVDHAGLEAMDHLISAGPATPTELARKLDISTAAMTLVLNRLELAGHLWRTRHPSDGRKLVVTADEESTEQVHRAVRPVIDGVEAAIAAMDDDERRAVTSFFDRLLNLYDEATPPL